MPNLRKSSNTAASLYADAFSRRTPPSQMTSPNCLKNENENEMKNLLKKVSTRCEIPTEDSQLTLVSRKKNRIILSVGWQDKLSMPPPLLRINYYQEGRPTASFKEAHKPKDVR